MGHAISQVRMTSAFRPRSDLHLTRKLWHILTGSFGLVFYKKSGIHIERMATILLIFAMAAFLFDFFRLRRPALNRVVLKFLRPIMRESEKNSVTGLPFYALGVSLSLFFFSPKIAILSVFFLVFADPIASFFGVLYGKDKLLPNKSLQGTIAAFTVCYVATLAYGLVHVGSSMNVLVFSIFAGLIGALSELCSQFVDDNLCIPVLSGLGLTLLNLLVPLF